MMKRVRELTVEVERFLKQQGTRNENGTFTIDKDIFLESIVDASEYRDKDGNIMFRYNFLERRINTKYYQTYERVSDLVSMEEFFSDVTMKMVETWKDKQTITIDFNGKIRDSISEIVFLIDKECHHEVLERNGIKKRSKTQRQKEIDSNGSASSYWKPFGELVYLDDVDENGELISESIGTDDVVGYEDITTSESDLDFELLINKFKLTKRQEEVLRVLDKNNGDRSKTARELGISRRGVQQTVVKIKDRVEKNFGHSSISQYNQNKPKVTDKLNELLDSDKFTEQKLLLFLVKHINDNSIIDLVAKVPLEVRKPFVRMVQKDILMSATDRDKFLSNFLQSYYNK